MSLYNEIKSKYQINRRRRPSRALTTDELHSIWNKKIELREFKLILDWSKISLKTDANGSTLKIWGKSSLQEMKSQMTSQNHHKFF